MIYSDGHVTADFITASKVFQASLKPVLPGRSGNSFPTCDMLAIQFDFTPWQGMGSVVVRYQCYL